VIRPRLGLRLAGSLVALAVLSRADTTVAPEVRSLFDKAEIAREEGRLEEAAAAFRSAIEKEPAYLEAIAAYLDTLRGLGDTAPARDLLDKLAGERPDSAEHAAFRAAALPPADAVKALAALVAQKPDSARAWLEFGRAHLLGGTTKDADKALREAIRRQPDLRTARLLLGDVALRDKKFDQARKEYGDLIAADPGYFAAHIRLALAWHRSKQSDKGIEVLEKVTADGNAPRHVGAHWALALIHEQKGDFKMAQEAIDRILAIRKDDLQALVAKGQILLEADQPGEAVKVFQQATTVKPDSALALFCLGWAHEKSADAPEIKDDAKRKERLAAAAAAYEACAKLNPGVRPRDSLGFVYLLGDKFEDGVTQFKRASDIDAGFAPAINNLGLSDDMADRRADAVKRYESVLQRIDKENVRARVMLALDLWLAGNTGGATKELEKALKVRPEDDLAWTFLGDIHYDIRKYDAAINAYKKATELNPKNFNAWYHLGIVYDEEKDNFEKADFCFRKGIEANVKPPADIYLRLGELNDEEFLNRLEDAVKFYQLYVDLGGTVDWVPQRISELKDLLASKK